MTPLRRACAALGLAGSVVAVSALAPPVPASAFTTFGFQLGIAQRDFRVFNNFADAAANDNAVPDANHPGAFGAVMAIWKGHVEWGSELHGDGNGDPHQPGDLGSGGANFDNTYQGEATTIGALDDNIHSELFACGGGGVLAFTEIPDSNGWRVRYCGELVFSDGPGTSIGAGFDLQGIATHQVGHTLGLGHSSVAGSTMTAFAPGNGVDWRSLHPDDIAGVQAIYGVKSVSKPRIDALGGSTAIGGTLVIDGVNFTDAGNEVWFTTLNSAGVATRVTGVAATGGGTQILVTVPPGIQDGDVLVKNGAGGSGSNLSNAFPIALDCGFYTDLGNGLAGTLGEPVLSGTGSLCEGDTVTLTLTNALPNATAYFVVGVAQLNAPLKGGILVPDISPPGFFLLLATDGAGEIPLSTPWPAGIPTGSTFVMQYWLEDPGGPAGFAASNGLQAEVN